MLSSVLKEISARKLIRLLNSIEGEKDLVIDKELICSLDKVANYAQLKECKVAKVFKLLPGSSPGNSKKCIYLIKPSVYYTQIVADHINEAKSANIDKQFWLINVPRKLHASQLILEKDGVYGYITQLVFDLGFLSIDNDVFSLEIPDFFEKFYLKGDYTEIHRASTGLLEFIRICRSSPKIFGQGNCAKKVVELMNLISENVEDLDESFKQQLDKIMKDSVNDPFGLTKISHLIVLDRDIDYVPLLLSQLTYEGMLDECFGINNGRVLFPKEVNGKEEVKVAVNSNDVVYNAIRNDYFACVFEYLRGKAKELQSKSETSNMSLGEIKNLVSKELKSIQMQHASLSIHIGACEVIMKKKTEEEFLKRLQIERDILEGLNLKEGLSYTHELILKHPPDVYTSPLRLMCLLSMSQEGVLPDDYYRLATDFRQTYGCTNFPIICKLTNLNLYVERKLPAESSNQSKTSKITEVAAVKASQIAEKVATAVAFPKYSSFRAINKRFKLIPPETEESVDMKNPKDMSYVYGGSYVPLIGRITEEIIVNDNLKQIEDSMKLLPGETIKNEKKEDKDTVSVLPSKKVIMVYVLGGITFAEIAALRFLAKTYGCRVIIATTNLTSFGSFIKMMSIKDVES
ncbi:hypothetical protein JTE90_002098 [Oedothorax gibbosus]|uniref:Vacuolar protein sorting-associated protein 33B n=1 Tax=Oedothorax gibbosus TaxID=931172 RepID=A0AAV6V9G5_9ARAC|nr:hypothetical protein JTE90_002098 [Oedothorax gibbosus]